MDRSCRRATSPMASPRVLGVDSTKTAWSGMKVAIGMQKSVARGRRSTDKAMSHRFVGI